jgi:hypothetical protein
LQIVAGGGVRSAADLRSLSAAGCDAALVASALHDGRLTIHDCAALGLSPPEYRETARRGRPAATTTSLRAFR